MDIKKWIPWNWFKKEEEETGKTLPVQRRSWRGRTRHRQHPVEQLHHHIDQIFDEMYRGFGLVPFSFEPLAPRMSEDLLKPTLDLSATDAEYTLSIEVPGVDEKDVKLEIVNDTLTIRGEKKQEKEEKEKNFYRMERSYGAFQRVLSLPEDVDQENVTAKFKKGVLTIKMPRKALPQSDVKKIEVKTG